MAFEFPHGTTADQRGTRPVPADVRLFVHDRAAGRCEDCGRQATLALHHLHYRSVGDEDPADLLALCRGCHVKRHVDANGDWWNDPEEMSDHWQT